MTLQSDLYSGKPRIAVTGRHVVSESIGGQIGHSIEIHFEPGAQLIAADGLRRPVLDLTGNGTNTIKIVSPAVDVSHGAYGGGQTNTAIALMGFRKATVADVDLFGGEDWASRNGDSGISTVDIEYTLIDGGVIRGFRDTAVYPGGNNALGPDGDGGVCDITGLHVYDCEHAVTAKREMTMCRIDRMHAENCTAGVIQSSVINGHYVGPARRMHVTNSTFKRITANVARFLSEGTGKFADNTIEDWGRYQDSTRNAGNNAVAISVLGAQDVRVRDNDLFERDWVGAGRIGLLIRDHKDIDGRHRVAGGVVSHGNDYGASQVLDTGSIRSHFRDVSRYQK